MSPAALLILAALLAAFGWALLQLGRERHVRFTPPDQPPPDRPEEQELRFDAEQILREQAEKPPPLRNPYMIDRALAQKSRQMNRENV